MNIKGNNSDKVLTMVCGTFCMPHMCELFLRYWDVVRKMKE